MLKKFYFIKKLSRASDREVVPTQIKKLKFIFKQTVEQLRRVGANILGVVLNEVDLHRSRYTYYYYRGYYQASRKYTDAVDGKKSSNGDKN